MTFNVAIKGKVSEQLKALDKSVYTLLVKRIARMRDEPPRRHLMHGADFFIIEVGQYRIAYTCEGNRKEIWFIGKHKNYDEWYSGKR
jgi:mRNA-degrading endonuclease RelE of RelBE toxin-antitoxin system